MNGLPRKAASILCCGKVSIWDSSTRVEGYRELEFLLSSGLGGHPEGGQAQVLHNLHVRWSPFQARWVCLLWLQEKEHCTTQVNSAATKRLGQCGWTTRVPGIRVSPASPLAHPCPGRLACTIRLPCAGAACPSPFRPSQPPTKPTPTLSPLLVCSSVIRIVCTILKGVSRAPIRNSHFRQETHNHM
jgi:hypothetical protein